jgi:streptogramin lyase
LILPSYFGVSLVINPVPAGVPFALTVRGLDPSNQLAENYRGSVHFTSSDGAATLPDDYTFTAADNGAHTFSVTLRAAGRQSVFVTDTVQSSLIGTAIIIDEFALAAQSSPREITAGPDGNLWFTEQSANKIGRITPGTFFTEFPIPTASSVPIGITAGPDGNLWFTENNSNKIGRITPAGFVTGEFPIPTPSSSPIGITAGPDGNLWFTELNANKIGRITPGGTVTEFPLATGSNPGGITAGPDGNLWFTETSANKIGWITPAGIISAAAVPTPGSSPFGITAGPDGNLWFTEVNANKIGRITPGGFFAEFPVPTANSGPFGITAGPDGNLWFTENFGNKIGQITPGGFLTEFPLATGTSTIGITAGPDGNLWFTQLTVSKVGRVFLGIDVTPAAADHFSLSAPDTVTSGAPFDLTVTVQDAFNNTVTGYTGTITFTTSDPDPGVVLPADYTFTVADGGVHTFTDTGLGETTLIAEGDQTVTATDTGSGITGTAPVTVTPAGEAPRGGGTGRRTLLMARPSAGPLVAGNGGMGIRGPTTYETESRMRSLSAGSDDSAGSPGATLPAPLPHEADAFFSRLASRVGKYSAVPVANDTTEGLIGDVIDPFSLNNGAVWI